MTRTSWSRGVVTRSAAACLLILAARTAGAQAGPGGAVITGRVTSEDGTPLPGANVFITEMTLSVGTSTNVVFTITVPAARVSGQSVQLRVRSVGFSPQAPRKANSFGLLGLRERASLLGGEVTIESAPGEGTIVEVRLPNEAPVASA